MEEEEERGSRRRWNQQSSQLGNTGLQINLAQAAINSECDLLQPQQ